MRRVVRKKDQEMLDANHFILMRAHSRCALPTKGRITETSPNRYKKEGERLQEEEEALRGLTSSALPFFSVFTGRGLEGFCKVLGVGGGSFSAGVFAFSMRVLATTDKGPA